MSGPLEAWKDERDREDDDRREGLLDDPEPREADPVFDDRDAFGG